MPEDDSLKKGQEFFQMFLKAKEFTEELLRENERLRFKLAHAETGGTDDRSRELSARVRDLEARLKTLHPYEVPEFVVLSILDGSHPYLSWLSDSTE